MSLCNERSIEIAHIASDGDAFASAYACITRHGVTGWRTQAREGTVHSYNANEWAGTTRHPVGRTDHREGSIRLVYAAFIPDDAIWARELFPEIPRTVDVDAS